MQPTPTSNNSHNLTPSFLDDATITDIENLTAPELNHLKNMLNNDATILAARSAVLQAAISSRYLDQAKTYLRANKLDTGTAHVIDGDIDVTVTIPKSVSWDQDGLLAELDQMEKEDARHYAKLSVTVSETMFKGAPPAVQRKLGKHRTLKPGKAKFEFKPAKKRAA